MGFAYFSYLSPLFGFAPTPFKRLDPQFKDCGIIDIPPFGLELSLSGLFIKEHFTLINDWIRIKCPLSAMKFDNVSNFSIYLRNYSNELPKELGFIHIPPKIGG